jgi:hypothetical protein
LEPRSSLLCPRRSSLSQMNSAQTVIDEYSPHHYIPKVQIAKLLIVQFSPAPVLKDCQCMCFVSWKRQSCTSIRSCKQSYSSVHFNFHVLRQQPRRQDSEVDGGM